jgi:hypothetical protein
VNVLDFQGTASMVPRTLCRRNKMPGTSLSSIALTTAPSGEVGVPDFERRSVSAGDRGHAVAYCLHGQRG